jgi:hypothetical protein
MDMNYRLHTAAFVAAFAAVMGPSLSARADGATQQSQLELQVDEAVAPSTVSQPLAGVVVTPGSNPLLRSDQRLALLSDSLPLDAKSGSVQPTDLQRLAALFPHTPEAATGDARRMMERNRAPASSNYGGEP